MTVVGLIDFPLGYSGRVANRQKKKKPSDAAETTAPKKKRRWLRRLVTSVIILGLLVGLGPMVTVRIASAGRLHSVDDVAAHDVAIVYGAGLSAYDQPSPYLAARLAIARDLYEAGKVKVIMVSGDNLTIEHNEPAAMINWLVKHGIPANKIVADYAGQDTYATCVRADRIFGVKSAILVSQTYHLHRAVATCRMVGLDAVGVGDESVRADWPMMWLTYQLREVLADIKMVFEVITGHETILGEHEDGVDKALGR